MEAQPLLLYDDSRNFNELQTSLHFPNKKGAVKTLFHCLLTFKR